MNQDSVIIVTYPDKTVIFCNGVIQEIRSIISECSSSWTIYFS